MKKYEARSEELEGGELRKRRMEILRTEIG